MPVIATPPKPAILDPKNDSVFDPLYQTLLKRGMRGLASLTGYDTPQGQVMQAMAPTPLVSIYKNAAERALGTQAFQDSAKPLGRNITRAANWLAREYPRIAAHMKINEEPISSTTAAAMAHIPYGKVKDPVPISFSIVGRASANLKEKNARQFIAHEATHVAQALGNRKTSELYDLADLAVGYEDNPLEVAARHRGTAAHTKDTTIWPGKIKISPDTPEAIHNRTVQALKDRGISLDTMGRGETRLRKWGTDYNDPANYVNPESLNLPPEVSADLEKLKMNPYDLIDSLHKRYTATRGLQNIAKGVTPVAGPEVPRNIGFPPYDPDKVIDALKRLLIERGMMDK